MKATLVGSGIFVALALQACAPTTARGLREGAPTFVRTSNRTVDQIVGCIADELEQGHVPSSYRPREHGGTITQGAADLATMVVDLEDLGTERRVTLYGPRTLFADLNRRRSERVAACL